MAIDAVMLLNRNMFIENGYGSEIEVFKWWFIKASDWFYAQLG